MIHSRYDIIGFSSSSGWEIVINWDEGKREIKPIIGWAIVCTESSHDEEKPDHEYENTDIYPVFIGSDGLPVTLYYFIDEYNKYLKDGRRYTIQRAVLCRVGGSRWVRYAVGGSVGGSKWCFTWSMGMWMDAPTAPTIRLLSATVGGSLPPPPRPGGPKGGGVHYQRVI